VSSGEAAHTPTPWLQVQGIKKNYLKQSDGERFVAQFPDDAQGLADLLHVQHVTDSHDQLKAENASLREGLRDVMSHGSTFNSPAGRAAAARAFALLDGQPISNPSKLELSALCKKLISHWEAVIAEEGNEFPVGAFDGVKDTLAHARALLNATPGQPVQDAPKSRRLRCQSCHGGGTLPNDEGPGSRPCQDCNGLGHYYAGTKPAQDPVKEELVAALENTERLAHDLMRRAAEIDRRLIALDGRKPDCELGEVVRLREQILNENRAALTRAKA